MSKPYISNIIKKEDVIISDNAPPTTHDRPYTKNDWAYTIGSIIQQGECLDLVRAQLLLWDHHLRIIKLFDEYGEWRDMSDILKDFAIFAKHERDL